MKFLDKLTGGAKKKTSRESKSARLSESPPLSALISDEGDFSDADVARRKAEFLELLAKEERAHRVKIAELRNEPVDNRRATDKNSVDKDETEVRSEPIRAVKPRTALPPITPTFETPSLGDDLSPRPETIAPAYDPSFTAKLSRPTKAQTRADIGKQIGGEDLFKSGTTSFSAPELTAKLPETAEREDVTPPEVSRSKVARPEERDAVPKPESYADMDFSRPVSGRANVSELRMDVSRIYSDIENGDALYRRAQQRVQGLMHFVEKAEVDFSLLERIEPENRRLKARNAMIAKELEDVVRKTSVLEADLDEHRRRLAEVNVQYDTVNGNLAKAMKALSERDREIRQLTNDISAITLKLDREKTATEVEIRENNVLRDRVVNLTNDLEDAKSSRADTSKVVESLKIDLEDHRSARERIETEAYDLRHALDDAQKQNNQMKGEMVALHQDISTFKTQYEFNIISRDDRIILLEAQIEDLARQLQVKDDIVSSAARDVTELRKSRTGGELERERLEKIIDTQTLQLEQAQKQILDGQAAIEEMDTRYRDVAAALSVTQNRRANQSPAHAPDIHPEMERDGVKAAKAATPRAEIVDDYGRRDKDAIEDHVMEYKLGLRNSLIPSHLADPRDRAILKDREDDASEPLAPRRDDNFDALDQETIAERIMDYKLGLRKNIF